VSYRFEIPPAVLLDQRAPQWIRGGLPADDVHAVGGVITDMWGGGSGGWLPEWSRLARRYVASGDHLRAALAYGVAKFPSIVDASRRRALAQQVTEYVSAAPTFPVRFERMIVAGAAVHILSAPGAAVDAPVLLVSGGVDTWKMDQHGVLVALVTGLAGHVVAFDLPGTGELADEPLTADADVLIAGLVRYGRTLSAGRVVHVGISFGGYFAARSGLRADVDAAVVIGGPVHAAFTEDNVRALRHGMYDIVANALGFDSRPELANLMPRLRTFDLEPLLGTAGNAPMFVVNGDADPYVPVEDTLVFQGRRDTEIVLVEGGGHCAFDRFHEVMSAVLHWLAPAGRATGRSA
jgi:esterase FrsA